MNFRYGYVPDPFRRAIRFFSRIFIAIFRLNGTSLFATELSQLLLPTSAVEFQGRRLVFRAGHGRLKWRAETFHSEEPLMIEWLKEFQAHDVFLDIGANVGTYTIPAATLVETVIAVELDPCNVFCLYSNVYLNNLTDKVIIIPLAAGNLESLVEVHYRDFSMGDALQSINRPQSLPSRQPNPHRLRQVSVPIDTLIRRYSIPQPSKIKIDVDGNEKLVMDGAWATLSKAREVYLEDNGLEADRELILKLGTLGYTLIKELPCGAGTVKTTIGRNIILRRNDY